MRYLRDVSAADVDAMRTMAEERPDVLRVLTVGVGGRVDAMRPPYADDVASVAVAIVARLYRGDAVAAVNAAVSMAVADVTRAHEMAGWDTYGDMSDLAEVNASDPLGTARTMCTRYGTAPADSQYRTNTRDVLGMLARAVPDHSAEALQRIYAEWLTHDETACAACSSGAGRKVSPLGIVAHAEGVTASDPVYHSSRRVAVAAFKRAEAASTAVLAEAYVPVAGTRTKVRKATPATSDHGPDYGAGMSALETFVARFPGCRKARTHATETVRDQSRDVPGVVSGIAYVFGKCTCGKPARWAGEEYGVTTSPARESDRRDNGMVRSFKPVVSPRKRAAGNTGPTVPVRLS